MLLRGLQEGRFLEALHEMAVLVTVTNIYRKFITKRNDYNQLYLANVVFLGLAGTGELHELPEPPVNDAKLD